MEKQTLKDNTIQRLLPLYRMIKRLFLDGCMQLQKHVNKEMEDNV